MDLPVAVGIDGSEASLAAADWAAREALLRDRPLRVLHALPLMPHLLPARAAADRPAGDLLHEVEHILAVRHPGLRMRTEEAHDAATAALLAAGEDAELMVLGARGSGGFPELRVGSTTLQLAARTGCPIVVLPAEPPGPHLREHVLVGVDARRPAEAALRFAFAAADRYGLPLRAVHAAPVPPGDRGGEAALLAAALEPWRTAHPEVELHEDVEHAGPGRALVEASAKARLLVLGRRPVGPVVLLGPVAHAVLHHAACPVAVVPGT
ncbi:universal stress protein [Kitasatospora paracochleata]|uniref:Nucleotide-binding universal stress UspA family protein n=1 Tax=Kitasatospora paracochleata TaxID=58354 RepID=A0ABT1IWK5_9ACTN|nr:universal stress protein [Kitasatospora paracochleata]MCP2309528.1 nucleotide-binding universal stress UspA family protein [Kitasatospora paracochleata]